MREATDIMAMTPRPFRVVDTMDEIPGVRTLVVEPLDGRPYAPEPGQFAMLTAPGFGECAISYSRISAESVSHTVRAVGEVSRALATMKSGSNIGVRGPFGRAWPVDAARGGDLLIVAGGLGLAPLRPVLEQVLTDRQSFRRVALVAGAREPGQFLFLDAVEALSSIDVELTVDAATATWTHDVGLVTTLLQHVCFDPASTTAMVCGPEVMMRFTALELVKQGVSPEQIVVSLERNMQCGIGLCGHCQLGPYFICKDGPVMPFSDVRKLLEIREY